MASNGSENNLVTDAVSGDRVALHRLLLKYGSRLTKHIAPRIPQSLQSVVSVDDIVQETFSYVFQNIQKCDSQTDQSFQVWLKTIAESRTQDAIRGLTRTKRGGRHRQVRRLVGAESSSVADLVELLSAGSQTPSRSAARHEAVDAVQQAIVNLPPDYRQAVQLRLLGGKSLEETAAVMKRSPRAVQGLVDRAKKKLRAALGTLSSYE